MSYRKEIDGLRAVAVVPVILFHAGFESFSGGFVGVDVFFVISGYLITTIILREQEAGSFSLLRFYERRARRILPALFLIVLCSLPFAWAWALPAQLRDFGESIVAVMVFASNILFWKGSGYFGAASEQIPLLHTWSLAVEEQFYILFPLVLILLAPLAKRWLALFLFLAAVASLSLSEWGWRYQPVANFYLAPTRAWELMIGALCAIYLRGSSKQDPFGLFSLLGCVLIVYAVFAFDNKTPFPSVYALVPTLGTALILVFNNQESWTQRILSSRLLVGLGLVSYSAYLWHQPLLAFARMRFGPLEPALALGLCAGSIVLAYFSWKYVETPFRQKDRVSTKRLISVLAATTVLLVLPAGWLIHSDGMIARFSPTDQKLVRYSPEHSGAYVTRRFDKLRLTEFTDNRKTKLFVVGDSYAQDLVNALVEAQLDHHFEISTHYIARRCGNLNLESDFTTHILPRNLPRCIKDGWYESPRVQALMERADVILLVSGWRQWQAELLPESLRNINSSFQAKVLVMGSKGVGRVDIRELLDLSPESRRTRRNKVVGEHRDASRYLAERLPADVFIDTQVLLCADDQTCPLFTPALELISYDGGHLTEAGAELLGRRLAAHPLIAEILSAD